MSQGSESAGDDPVVQQDLWLGYDGLLAPMHLISALLVYQSAWDRRILHGYGRVPSDVQSVVLLHDGRVLPSRRSLADLRARWNAWQSDQEEDSAAPPGRASEQDDTAAATDQD